MDPLGWRNSFILHFFNFLQYICAETVGFIVLHSHAHVRRHTHTHTPNGYLNTSAVNVLGDQYKLNLCLWSVVFLMLAKLS